MNRTLPLQLAALALLLGAAAVACDEDDVILSPGDGDLATVIDSADDFPEPEERTDTLATSVETETRNGELWSCTTRTLDVTRAPEAFPLFDPNSEIVFPGNLLQGKTLADATPEPIPVRRGPGTVTLTLVNGTDAGASRKIQEVSIGSVFDALNSIIASSPNEIPARFEFEFQEIHSEREFAFHLDINGPAYFKNLGASFDFSRTRDYNRFFVKLTQAFYTMAYEIPTSVGGFFHPTVTPEELSRFVARDNPAAFISSVTYGRIFILLIESTERSDSIAGSIKATFTSGGGSIEGRFLSKLKDVNIRAFALGGDAGKALQAVTDTFSAVRNFLAEGGNIRTGVPISYVVRSAKQPQKIVKVALNTRYDVKDCVPLGETFSNPIIWLKADVEGIEQPFADNRVTKWPDVSLAKNDAFVTTFPNSCCPEWLDNRVSGIKPAVAFRGTNNTSPERRYLRYYGEQFVDSDYTIMMVMAGLDGTGGTNFPYYFVSGENLEPQKTLRVGFPSRDKFRVDHYEGEGIEAFAPVANASQSENPRYRLYTVTFSKTNGMHLYIDGTLVSQNPNATQPIQSYRGARIGNYEPVNTDQVTVFIAEFIAYASVLTDTQRKAVEGDLKRKYVF